jgi:hypothetical protein
MSKNLTRKGLALGALVALCSSVIAGAPAQAAQTVTVAPALGTSLVTTVGTKFVVSANVGSGVTDTAAGTLKFSISNAGKNLKTFVATPAATAALANTAALAGTTVADTTNTTIVTAASVTTSAKTAAVAIETTATATTTADVTAFLDLNGNGVVDGGEDTGNTITIKFIANADLTVAATLTQPLIGATALVGKATTTPALNGNYATDVKLVYTSQTVMTPANGEYAGVQATDGSWSANAATVAATAGAYTVQLKTANGLLGTAVTATTPAITVATGTAALTVGNDTLANGNVRSGAKAATAVLTYKDGATTPVAVKAGVPVVVTVTTSAVAAPATSLITVAGKAISTTNTTGTITIDATTDANGQVSLPITSATGTTGDKITISAVAEGVALTANLAVEWKAVVYTLTDSKDETNASALRAMTRGGTLNFDLEAKDQFGVAISGGARAVLTATGGTAGTFYYTFVGGKVTAEYKDTQTTTTTSNVLNFALQTQDSASLNWAAPSTGAVALAAGAVTAVVSSTAFSFDTVPNQTANTFTGTVSANALTASPTNAVSIVGAAGSLSTALAGQPVKVSGTDLAFLVNTKVYQGSVEFFSGANGDFTVSVYSTKSGPQTVTFTTGAATSTVVVTFAAGAVALVSLEAPAQAQVGQALDVVVKTTDKWGNAKGSAASTVADDNAGDLTLSSTGTGYFANTTPVTNASGVATVKYIVGTADIGTAFLSASLDLATNVTGARSIEFGLTDGDVLAGGKRVFVSAEFAKGRTVSVSINGKRIYSKVQTTDNAVELAFTQRRAGTYTVTVRISGGIVFTEKVRVN